MAQQSKQPSWSDQHDDVLAALKALKVPEKEARKLLTPIERQAGPGELLRMALRARAGGTKRPPVSAGGPTGAVPINPPVAAQTTPAPASTKPAPAPIKTNPGTPGRSKPWSFREIFLGDLGKKKTPPTSQVSAAAPSTVSPTPPPQPQTPAPQPAPSPVAAAQMPPAAPISPAAAQTQPSGTKPRIQVQAVGRPVPPAPIGGAPAVANPQTATPVFIKSYEEYEALAPGTEFLWPNGHVYRKKVQA